MDWKSNYEKARRAFGYSVKNHDSATSTKNKENVLQTVNLQKRSKKRGREDLPSVNDRVKRLKVQDDPVPKAPKELLKEKVRN